MNECCDLTWALQKLTETQLRLLIVGAEKWCSLVTQLMNSSRLYRFIRTFSKIWLFSQQFLRQSQLSSPYVSSYCDLNSLCPIWDRLPYWIWPEADVNNAATCPGPIVHQRVKSPHCGPKRGWVTDNSTNVHGEVVGGNFVPPISRNWWKTFSQ